jgi:hypothetical protein
VVVIAGVNGIFVAAGITLALVLALLGAALALRTRRFVTSRASSARTRRGLSAERAAEKLLARHGYRVLERRVAGSYEILVDGEAQRVQLYADFLVSRAGRELLVEVKTGDATHLGHADTRRQMLEYQLAFAVPALVLVDADQETLHEVEFPLARSRAQSAWPLALAATACSALAWLLLRG